MLKVNLKPVELKAIRLSLGLDVAEASEICEVTKRTFQYYESGGRSIPDDVVKTFTQYAHVYWLVHKNMGEDIEAWNERYPYPKTDSTEEYARLVKQRPKLKMPFYRTLEDFKKYTGNPKVFSFRVYQSVVNHYFTLELIKDLVEDALVPEDFKQTKFWLEGGYDDYASDEDD